jgi:hypothetical protein
MVMPTALFLILAAVTFRILPPLLHAQNFWLQNFSPVASLVVCGAIYFPKRMAAWIPFTILLASDFILNHFVYGKPFFSLEIIPRYFAFLVIGGLVFRYRSLLRDKQFALLGASFMGALLYFLITNIASWAGDPGYAKTVAGLWQALTQGLPEYPSTLTFFRNSVVGDLFFTALFIVCMLATAKEKNVAVTKIVVAQ